MPNQKVEFDDTFQMMEIFGTCDANVKLIEKALSVQIISNQNTVEVRGEEESAARALRALETLKQMREAGTKLNDSAVVQALELAQDGHVEEAIGAMKDVITVNHRGQPVKCRTLGQKKYIEAIRKNTVTICIGPAGTGKTFLAVAVAVNALREKLIDRIIVSRPAIEAGEKLGFLPGDLQQKVDPYLRPLYDSFHSLIGTEKTQQYLEKGVIEIAPIAYMRGRTLDNAMVLVDEGQNASLETLKMVLTRFGENSKVVLTGDITQIDLPREQSSGLARCAKILSGIDGIEVIHLTNRDVVRHRLVKDIVKAFEKYDEPKQETEKYRSPSPDRKNKKR